MTASLWSSKLLGLAVRVWGDGGWLRVFNYVMPGAFHHLAWHTDRQRVRRQRVPGEASYTHQLRAFVASVRDGALVPTSARDAVANMTVIDSIYRAAGLEPRR
jgi:predicted dehydrogenase